MKNLIVAALLIMFAFGASAAYADGDYEMPLVQGLTTGSATLAVGAGTYLDIQTLTGIEASTFKTINLVVRVVLEPNLSTALSHTSLNVIASNLSTTFNPNPSSAAVTGMVLHSDGVQVGYLRVVKRFLHLWSFSPNGVGTSYYCIVRVKQ